MEFSAPQNWATWLVGLLTAALLWVVRGYAADVKHIKGNYVTRKDLAEALAASDARALQYDLRQTSMHEANTRNFSELRSQLEGVNTKLFELAKMKQP